MKKKSETFNGYTCADCGRNVTSLYSTVVGKQNGKFLVKEVCWVCSNDNEE